MLVIHDENGVITQCVMQSALTLEVLSERYKEMGRTHVMHDGEGDITNSYVKDGAVVAKPQIEVTGDIRPIKADGADELTLLISPGDVTVLVLFDGKPVHQEQITTGALEFAADHPGSYTLIVSAPHPYQPTQIIVEAV